MSTTHLTDAEFLQVYRIVSKQDQPVPSYFDPKILKERYKLTTDDLYHIRMGHYRKHLFVKDGPVQTYNDFMDKIDDCFNRIEEALREAVSWQKKARGAL